MAQVFGSAIDVGRCQVECIHPDTIRPLIGRTLGADGSHAVAELFAALADPSRARIIQLLAISDHELCVCDMALVLGMTVSALSHQLRALRERGAVSRRKVGRIAYYRLVDARLQRLILDTAVHIAEDRA